MSAAAGTLAPFGTWDFGIELGRKPKPVRQPSQAVAAVSTMSNASHPERALAGQGSTAPLDPALAGKTTALKGQVEQDWPAIVGRCLRGDSLAWTELVRAHHGRVYSMCYRFTGSSHDAEDLTQDIFLKVYGSLRVFDPARGSLAVWVTTMTRNHLVDHYRRSRLERASDSLDAGWDEAGAELGGGIHLEDARPGPHENALQRELAREVQAALAQVSPELREAVILRDLQDLDYREIATVLRVPEGTVKSRISRGRAELARVLARKGKQVS